MVRMPAVAKSLCCLVGDPVVARMKDDRVSLANGSHLIQYLHRRPGRLIRGLAVRKRPLDDDKMRRRAGRIVMQFTEIPRPPNVGPESPPQDVPSGDDLDCPAKVNGRHSAIPNPYHSIASRSNAFGPFGVCSKFVGGLDLNLGWSRVVLLRGLPRDADR